MSIQVSQPVPCSLVAAFTILASVLGCNDGFSPIMLASSYELQRVNDSALPFNAPGEPPPSSTPIRIERGAITFLSSSLAERSERVAYTMALPSGDSIVQFLEWTSAGPFRREGNRLIIRYPLWRSALDGGPLWPEDTLRFSADGLTHQVNNGSVSITRFYGALR